MGKVNGHPAGSSAIIRKAFVMDPAQVAGFELQKTNPRHAKEGYKQRFEERGKQKSPCKHSVEVHKGPTHRPKGMGRESWIKLMASR